LLIRCSVPRIGVRPMIVPLGETAITFRQLANNERFSRQSHIHGWSQEVLARAKLLIAGCGALGNETLKNLALLGIGTLGIIDFDSVEVTNLSRSVLFRETDVGQPKVHVAALRLAELNPEIKVTSIHLDLTSELGAGTIADYDLVLGCLDNIEARWRLNRLCYSAGVSWIDAGIEATAGQIAYFDAHNGPCYECSMTSSMWQRLNEKRSCLLPVQSAASPHIATSSIISSLLSSLQAQEAVAQLHHRFAPLPTRSKWSVLQSGDRVSTSLAPYSISVMHAKRNDACLAHSGESIETFDFEVSPSQISVEQILARTNMDALELDWDIAIAFDCPTCGTEPVCLPSFRVVASALNCPGCCHPRRPEWQNRITRESRLATQTLAELGTPPRAYLSLVTNHGHHLRCRLHEY
jgi:molybdopterin/thiamine biosynthesis adenylyltransferase